MLRMRPLIRGKYFDDFEFLWLVVLNGFVWSWPEPWASPYYWTSPTWSGWCMGYKIWVWSDPGIDKWPNGSALHVFQFLIFLSDKIYNKKLLFFTYMQKGSIVKKTHKITTHCQILYWQILPLIDVNSCFSFSFSIESTLIQSNFAVFLLIDRKSEFNTFFVSLAPSYSPKLKGRTC